MKMGVMGGTFDPIHNAHLEVAHAACRLIKLDKVLFIPAGQPWMKTSQVTPAEHRAAMVRAAVRGNPHFELSLIEINRSGPTYTVDTLDELRQSGLHGELYLIIGWDKLTEFPDWHNAEQIIRHSHIIAAPRPHFPPPNLPALEKQVPGISARIILLDEPALNVSSSEIRRRVAAGQSIRHLVPPDVEQYIIEHGLYRDTEK